MERNLICKIRVSMKNLFMMINFIFCQMWAGKTESSTDMLKNPVGIMGLIGSPNWMIN